jgi:hypothetical protein
MKQKAAIVGTAASWRLVPWHDPDLLICGLNDAYQLKGWKRADEWYDIHPTNKYFLTTTPVVQHQVPPGHYVRPAGHLDWMAKQQGPMWLHPDHATLYPPSASWPFAKAFPKTDIEASYGDYETSTPAWMIAHLHQQGYREIHVYGIHLATEFEYMRQRPNFEYLIGRILGPGKVTKTVKQEMRYYESPDAIIALPEASPVLASDFQYAFQERPDAHLAPLQWDLHRFTVKRDRALKGLLGRAWWQSPKKLKQDMAVWEAHLADTREQIQRHDVQAQWR